MVKRKDNKNCRCKYAGDEEPLHSPCRFGYCTIIRCPGCGMILMQWGPVACPHKKNENGTLRWFKYPDMDTKTHVPVKESIMRKRNQPRKW